MNSKRFSKVIVFGKHDCKFCDLAKDKFQRLEIPFTFKEIQPFTQHHEGWRTDGSVEVNAAYQLHELALPIISIDGQFFTYPTAMLYVKNKQAKTPISVAVTKEEPTLAIVA